MSPPLCISGRPVAKRLTSGAHHGGHFDHAATMLGCEINAPAQGTITKQREGVLMVLDRLTARQTALGAALVLGMALASFGAPDALAQNVLRIGNSGEPDSLDPHQVSGNWEDRIVGDMFMGLTTEAADGTVVPGAAESWTISDDGLTYTFKLRDHTWSDGTPVTADDFVFALRRILDPATAAEYAYILYPIKNAEAINSGNLADLDALGVRAIDPKTLEITLERPTSYFVEQLTHYTAYPVPKHKVDELGDDWVKPDNIVGNGPYTVVEWVPNSHVKMVKNPNFYDADNVAIDEVVYFPTEERNAGTKQFRAGELDVQYDFASEQIDLLKENLPEATHISPELAAYYYVFNTKAAAVRRRPGARGPGHGDRPQGDHREGAAHRRGAGLQPGAAEHRRLRRAAAGSSGRTCPTPSGSSRPRSCWPRPATAPTTR